MTAFRGPQNLQLGHPVWASAKYDPTTRDYVIELDGDDVDRFRAVAELYRFREDDGSEPEPPHDPPADDQGGDDDVPDPEPTGDGHERDYVDLAHAIDNARDDDESDDSEDSSDDESEDSDDEPEPTPEPAKPARRARRGRSQG